MPRAFSPTALRAGAALGLVIALAASAPGQTTIYSSNGFESPTFTTGTIFNQQANQWNVFPSNPAGQIQTGTVRNGSQAFQVVGPSMIVPGFSGTGANFWFRDDFNYNPVASSNPFVQVQFAGRRSTSGFFDMPFAGVYVEGLTSSNQQQGLLTVMIGSQGQLAVSTNFVSTIGGTTGTVKTATGQFGADAWHGLFAELNFATQTYRVYREGNPTPLQFETAVGTFITDIPFRNANGATVSVREIGMLAFNFNDGSSETAPTNNFFIDDYLVTASPTSLAPVPEPGLVLAVGAVGLAGWRVYRRRRIALA